MVPSSGRMILQPNFKRSRPATIQTLLGTKHSCVVYQFSEVNYVALSNSRHLLKTTRSAFDVPVPTLNVRGIWLQHLSPHWSSQEFMQSKKQERELHDFSEKPALHSPIYASHSHCIHHWDANVACSPLMRVHLLQYACCMQPALDIQLTSYIQSF